MKHAHPLFRALLGGGFTFTILCSLGNFAAAQTCVQPPAGLVSWWPGDGETQDIAGSNAGTLEGGATFAAGKVGPAFSFDGSADFVEIPDGALWTFGDNPFTIDLWVNFREVPDRAPFIDHNEGPGERNKWIFWFDNIGHGIPGPALRFHINSPSLGPLDPVLAPWSPNPGQWYHVAVTRSGSTYTLYIDGVQVATNTDTNTIPDANVPLTIGQSEQQYFFNGLIDEVEIYHRALSAAEIHAIFNAGSAGKCKIVNDFVAFEPLPSTYRFTTDTTGCPARFVGIFSFDARLTNISDRSLTLLAAQVTTLTNGNLLLNADGGPGGVGVRLTVPRLDGFTDGVLSAEEFVDVPFAICLRERSPFHFFVDVSGVVGDAATQVLLPYLSPGYRFLVVPLGEGVGFEQPDFDDSHFEVGDAAFGTGDFCPLDPTVQTPWPLQTDLLLRKTFTVPVNATTVRVAVAIDNDIQMFINGVDISGGLQQNEGCAERDRFIFAVPENLLVFDGENLLAVRARDRGVISYVDVEIRAMLPPP